MAVSVLMSPTTPNVTNTNLVYTLSSSYSGNPQFRYVTDIYESGSVELLGSLYTYPNSHGTVNIDVARELNDRLDYDNFWKITGSAAPINAVKTFDLRFGEQYGTSLSSSVTTYTGSTPNYLQVFPGHVYANQGSYNFNTSSFVTPSEGNAYLTNDPAAQTDLNTPDGDYAYLMNSTDYFTLTILEDTVAGPGIIIAGRYVENGVSTFVTNSYFPFTAPSGAFNTVGIGPQNLSDYSSGWADYFASGSINALYTTNDPGGIAIYINDLWDGIPGTDANIGVRNITKPCQDEYTRFAFINQYGFWDYYNVYNPLRRQSQVNRSTYERPFVSYGELQASYDITNRGNTQYYTQYNDIYEITTDYLNKDYADWLTELFESPDVYIQSGTDFIPVNILNTQVTWNLDQNRNKLFQYTITFKYANQREPR